jgi:hypothetical protein
VAVTVTVTMQLDGLLTLKEMEEGVDMCTQRPDTFLSQTGFLA